ncbi:MAG: imidazolonepropionase [Bacteroidales bacterium]|nr:imidazolonepropionase [Bacteroidales bacterium]
MKKLIRDIGQIAGIVEAGVMRKEGVSMSETGTLENAWLLIEDDKIACFGSMSDCPDLSQESGQDSFDVIDADGGFVLPAFCDSHSHIVFAGTREQEFLDKIKGLSYAEIAAHGGGILNSADLLHNTSEDELYRQAMERVNEMIAKGTGAIEIKSGYGLTTQDELKILRVIKRIRENSPAIIKSTFLGAHAVGRAFTGRQSEYVDHVCNEMIPAVAAEHLADFVDVFCEDGFFTPEETDRILTAGEHYGMRVKLHANQLAVSGGVQVGVKHNALSVDHLESTTDEEIRVLKDSCTMPTMLPGASFFLRMQYGKALDFINSGLGIALASDYNPGSSPCGDMRFVMSLGCIQMRLTPIQALNACTLNSAYAMGISDVAGSITAGKFANLIITKRIPSLTWIPYCYQTPFIDRVLLRGRTV